MMSIKKLLSLQFFLVLLIFFGKIQALEVAGIPVPETVVLEDKQNKLHLQGAGVRTKLFFDIYIGAFYATKKIETPQHALSNTGPKRMWLHFLYKKVSSNEYKDAWIDGIKANNSEATVDHYKKEIDNFISLFHEDLVAGDNLTLDYIPNKGTMVTMNGQLKAVIPGEGFYSILLSTWMGKKPPSQKFQDALLSESTDD